MYNHDCGSSLPRYTHTMRLSLPWFLELFQYKNWSEYCMYAWMNAIDSQLFITNHHQPIVVTPSHCTKAMDSTIVVVEVLRLNKITSLSFCTTKDVCWIALVAWAKFWANWACTRCFKSFPQFPTELCHSWMPVSKTNLGSLRYGPCHGHWCLSIAYPRKILLSWMITQTWIAPIWEPCCV